MKIPVILICILLSLNSFAQPTIKGRVVNELTGAPIPGSSVFISNTSKGTVTDSEGRFELTDVPSGKHELVISSIGYETNVFSFTDQKLPLQLKVELKIKVKEMDNVILEPSVEEGWDKWGKMFNEYFIGTANNASQCKIKNTGDIKFRYYKKANKVIAYSDVPIIMENDALGYVIHYQLENFEVNYSERTSFFLGYPLFEDQQKKENPKQKWVERRKEAYKGSVTHFMYSVYHNRLLDEGFEVRRMVRQPNLEKIRVKSIYKGPGVMYRTNSKTGETVMDLSDGVLGLSKDSVSYYQKVLHQPDYTDIYGKDLLTGDSLIVKTEGEFKAMYFDHFLSITYKNELESKKYLQLTMENRKPGFQRSLVFILTENILSLDKSGNYYNPQDFLTTGYWGWSEKMADLLPLDYDPGK